jgi:hypothetical protein
MSQGGSSRDRKVVDAGPCQDLICCARANAARGDGAFSHALGRLRLAGAPIFPSDDDDDGDGGTDSTWPCMRIVPGWFCDTATGAAARAPMAWVGVSPLPPGYVPGRVKMHGWKRARDDTSLAASLDAAI